MSIQKRNRRLFTFSGIAAAVLGAWLLATPLSPANADAFFGLDLGGVGVGVGVPTYAPPPPYYDYSYAPPAYYYAPPPAYYSYYGYAPGYVVYR